MNKNVSKNNKIIELIMRMGIEYRTGKFSMSELWNLAEKQVNQGARAKPSNFEIEAFDAWKKIGNHKLKYAMVYQNSVLKVIRYIDLPTDTYLVRWSTKPHWDDYSWISGIPVIDSV